MSEVSKDALLGLIILVLVGGITAGALHGKREPVPVEQSAAPVK